MVFSSIPFVCGFLPIVFIIYLLLPGIRLKNLFLILASLIFYAIGESVYVFLMIGCVLWNYIFAIGMSRASGNYRKALTS